MLKVCAVFPLPEGVGKFALAVLPRKTGLSIHSHYEKLVLWTAAERQATACSVCECQRLLEVQLQDGYLAEICQEGQA